MTKERSSLFQGKGLRKSGARDAILGVFSRSLKPISASEVLDKLSRKGMAVNKTTVYRELETLKKIGYVKEIFFRNDTALYELAGDHHHHLVCISCGDIREVRLNESLDREEKRLARQERFVILEHSLEFFGMCEQCQ